MITQVRERLSKFVRDHFLFHRTPIAFYTTIPVPCETGKLEVYLSQGEQKRAARFHFRSDRDGFIAAHAIKRISLSALTGLPPKDVPVHLGSHGKPMLGSIGQISAIQFNLSHTAELVAFAVALDTPIGVDVERINPVMKSETLARSFFAAQEIDLLNSVPEAERRCAFFQLWTIKEAYIKGIGLGLGQPLQSFFVQSFDWQSRICDSQTGAPLDWITQSYKPTPEHYMSSAIMCSNEHNADVTFLKLPFFKIS